MNREKLEYYTGAAFVMCIVLVVSMVWINPWIIENFPNAIKNEPVPDPIIVGIIFVTVLAVTYSWWRYGIPQTGENPDRE